MIKVRLRHQFGDFSLDVAFEAAEGITALFGRSGAGKSTVLSAVAGFLTPREGTIVVAGRVVFDDTRGVNVRAHRRRIGTVFQDARLFPHMTVAQNLRFAERFASGQTDTPRLIALLGLGALLGRRPAALSGGEKQRVAIARALLSRPDALLLDEPLAALDGARKAEILDHLAKLARQTAVPMLYVSHSPSEVARLADQVVLLKAGRTIDAGPTSYVLADAEAAAMMGVRDAGGVLEGRVARHDPDDGLTEVALSAGVLVVPTIDAPVATPVRIRLRATDVILAGSAPEGLSTRNILAVRVAHVVEGEGPGVLVTLVCGPDRLLARVTRRAARALAIAPGVSCFAVLKALAVPPEDVAVLAEAAHDPVRTHSP